MTGGTGRDARLHRWAWAAWAAANLVGIALVVLADDDTRLVTLGRDHGPSAGEALGALLVIAGWVGLDAVTVRQWSHSRWSARTKRAAVGVALVGAAALVPAVALGTGWSWILGATLLAGVQLAAAFSVRPPRGVQASSR